LIHRKQKNTAEAAVLAVFKNPSCKTVLWWRISPRGKKMEEIQTAASATAKSAHYKTASS
jgi:hypothetical protein